MYICCLLWNVLFYAKEIISLEDCFLLIIAYHNKSLVHRITWTGIPHTPIIREIRSDFTFDYLHYQLPHMHRFLFLFACTRQSLLCSEMLSSWHRLARIYSTVNFEVGFGAWGSWSGSGTFSGLTPSPTSMSLSTFELSPGIKWVTGCCFFELVSCGIFSGRQIPLSFWCFSFLVNAYIGSWMCRSFVCCNCTLNSGKMIHIVCSAQN